MIEKTYTCSNRMLYGVMSLAVLGVCGYKLQSGLGDYQSWVAIIAGVITLIWGGYFILLRYRVDEEGISRILVGRKRIKWEEKVDIGIEEEEQGGQARKRVWIEGVDGVRIEMSSDLISLERMEEFVGDLREAGILG